MIIAIESVDAGGKATQTKLLVERLRAAGVRADSTSFPDYSTEIGQTILALLKGEVYVKRGGAPDPAATAILVQAVMTTNRYEVRAKLLAWEQALTEPSCMLPAVLVLDRYWISGLVYGMADGLDEAMLLAVHAALPRAHHIFLDVSPEEGLRRRPEARDRYERDRGMQERVRENYRGVFARPPECLAGRVHTVSGEGTIEEVSDRVWEVVGRVIGS